MLPTDDFTASTLDIYKDELNRHYLYPHTNGKYALIELMNKDFQKKMALKAGLPVSDSWLVDIKGGTYVLPNDIIYPCFPKPQISFLGNKRCMKKCSSELELRNVLDTVAMERDCPMLIEKFIPIEKEYGILGFIDDDKIILPAMVDKMEIGHGSHEGVTLLGKLISTEDIAEFIKSLEKFLISIGFVGLIDIDLYESNNILYFNELNLRMGAFGYAAVCGNVNLPMMFVKRMENKSYQKYNKRLNKEIICLSDKVNEEDLNAGFISRKKYLNNIKSSDFRFLFVKRDLKPFIAFKMNSYFQRIKKLLK
ncbi:MAG: hypothetical protein LUF86_04495 [Clostridiales bacterium]|nr:hypothetical protein [Clostridiales bacterium]